MLHREFSHTIHRPISDTFASAAGPVAARPRPARFETARAALVLPTPAQDPQVYATNGAYYYCESSPSGIYVRRADDFLDFGSAERRRVWAPAAHGPASHNLWAPELHRIDGRHHLYFAADDGRNENHRMWVLAARTDDPAGDYELVGALETDGWAIDGTTFAMPDGSRYFLWSGWPGRTDGQQNLYLAPMRSPTQLAAPRVLLTTPDQPWERRGLPLCEGPQVLQHAGRTFVVYSASGSWTPDYCLGLLECTGRDVLDPAAWHKHGCVFRRNPHAWGVGHCGFATTTAGEPWLLYHAKTSRRPGWTDREVRAQPFAWRDDGLPDFGEPLPLAGTILPAAGGRSARRLKPDRTAPLPGSPHPLLPLRVED